MMYIGMNMLSMKKDPRDTGHRFDIGGFDMGQ